MARSGLYDYLGLQLASETPLLQITPRRRKVGNSGLTAVPAGGSALVIASVSMDAADVLQANDGIIFDLIQAAYFAAAAPGITISSLTFQIQNAGATNVFPIGNLTLALPGVSSSLGAPSIAGIQVPQLLDSFDLHFGIDSLLGALPLAEQPLNFRMAGLFANSSAGAINVNVAMWTFYRIVRGLQEA